MELEIWLCHAARPYPWAIPPKLIALLRTYGILVVLTYLLPTHLRSAFEVVAEPEAVKCQRVGCLTVSTVKLGSERGRMTLSDYEKCEITCETYTKKWATSYSSDTAPWKHFDLCQSAPGFVMNLEDAVPVENWQYSRRDGDRSSRACLRQPVVSNCFCFVSVFLIAWKPHANWVSPSASSLCENQAICRRVTKAASAFGDKKVSEFDTVDRDGAWTDCFGFMGTLKAKFPDFFYRSGVRSLRTLHERASELDEIQLAPVTAQEAVSVRQFHLPPAEGLNAITYQHMGHFGGGYVWSFEEEEERHQIASFWDDVEQAYHEMEEIDLDKMDIREIIREPGWKGKKTSEEAGTSQHSLPFL